MVAVAIVAASSVSMGLRPLSGMTDADERRSAALGPLVAHEDAREAARVLAGLHTGLTSDEVARLGIAIVQASRSAGIPAALVLALIEVESSGNAFAVSNVGAIGLMQLRPRTAEEVAGRLGITWTGASSLFDPVMNVRLGVEYLRHLIARYDDVSTALAAYNWGPGRIGEKLHRGEAIPAAYANKVLAKFRRPLSTSA